MPMQASTRNLKGLDLSELQAFFETLGEKPFRARQVFQWIYQKAVCGFNQMTNLPKSFRSKLSEVAYIGCIEEAARQVAHDGTAKFLFRLEDGETIESVLMTHRYGISACVSSQVGCRMGCAFCASTIGGVVRDLTAGEMIDQVLAMSRWLWEERPRGKDREDAGRISSIVIMGSGEPLENYDNVLKFIGLANSPDGPGIGYRHITLSTCGIIPGIRKLMNEGLPITLSISLHAPTDELRNRLVPVNRRYPIQDLMRTCREYTEVTRRRITFEYALASGVNDSDEAARQLAHLLRGMLAHVNLIPVNPVPERGFDRPSPGRIEGFRATLERSGIEATVRRELGTDIDAACGQLRARRQGRLR